MPKTSRVTFRIDTDDLAFAKRLAQSEGFSLSNYLSRALARLRTDMADEEPSREIRDITQLLPAQTDIRESHRQSVLGTQWVEASTTPRKVNRRPATKILFDHAILLDILQARGHAYAASATLCTRADRHEFQACLAADSAAFLIDAIHRYAGKRKGRGGLRWILRAFVLLPLGRAEILRAETLRFINYDDALLAATAEANGCDLILTRQLTAFKFSPVPAATPEEFLADKPR